MEKHYYMFVYQVRVLIDQQTRNQSLNKLQTNSLFNRCAKHWLTVYVYKWHREWDRYIYMRTEKKNKSSIYIYRVRPKKTDKNLNNCCWTVANIYTIFFRIERKRVFQKRNKYLLLVFGWQNDWLYRCEMFMQTNTAQPSSRIHCSFCGINK